MAECRVSKEPQRRNPTDLKLAWALHLEKPSFCALLAQPPAEQWEHPEETSPLLGISFQSARKSRSGRKDLKLMHCDQNWYPAPSNLS